MHLFTRAADLRHFTEAERRAGRTLGLVPTMGALHAGHLALVAAACAGCDTVVASVFVNPTQFTNPDDLRLYPRQPEADAALLAGAGCHALFLPEAAELYPAPPVLRFDFGPLERVMEGASRPGHFSGVGLVVSKLFHLARPHRAYFGQKDAQQVAVIRQLVLDLSFDLELVVCPTLRAPDGLALSSRNQRLSPAARALAPRLYETLSAAAAAVHQGVAPAQVQQQALAELAHTPEFTPDYFEVVDADTLQPLAGYAPGRPVLLCLAAWLDGVRLIDNVVVQ